MVHLKVFCTVVLIFIGSLCVAAEPVKEAADSDSSPSFNRIGHWSFDELPSGEAVGKVSVTRSGPASPRFPDFAEQNSALSIESPSYLRLSSDDSQRFDFDSGDAITVEVWVNLNSIVENAYIIGKGRTEGSGPKSKDQNWAVRLRRRGGDACLNFLFRSRDDDATPGDWHRWTSKSGFGAGSGWHHIAVSYRFGEAKSIRGFLDGKKIPGDWDMGGETDRAPVATDSEVWIGSAMSGAKSNSLDGQLDELAVYRDQLPDDVLINRFKFVPKPIERPDVPENKIVCELFGPFDGISAIPTRIDQPQRSWQQYSMGFTRLPFNYDSWGVRDDWTDGDQKTMFVRAWADVALDPGDYQLMLRSRSFSRLFVDGTEVVATPPQVSRAGAHHVVDPLPEVSVTGMRPHFMNDSERIVDFHSDGGTHQLMYEVIVGGPSYRLEFGETCVALARQGEMFNIVSHRREYPLTDDGWNRFASDQATLLKQLDSQTRHLQSSQQDGYWQRRHQYAKQNLISGSEASIDAIIESRIARENDQRARITPVAETDSSYRDHVLPILQSHCVRCHGEKQKGELTVTDRKSLLSGGESGEPAVVPGEPDESYLVELVSAAADDYRMPPKGDGVSKEDVATIRKWIADGAVMPVDAKPAIELTKQTGAYAFLRRVFIDTVGVPPSIAEANEFLNDTSPLRRQKLIDRLLNDQRWADNWVGYWQDALAENPNLLKPTLNNTGPFRYWIYEALRDNKPMDRFATELILMRGSQWYGGAGGFAIASQNDVPMAAKAHVIGTAFMGVEMKCARCHDAPYHSWKQSDLFEIAAMLDRKSIKVPETSTVPVAFFEQQEREPLIKVTLKPGATVHGQWPFAKFAPAIAAEILQSPTDSREKLSAQVTASRRFAEVIANRIWKRLMGAGIVQPVDDWEGNPPSDPQLLATLADTLIKSDYNAKSLARLILTSNAYQRKAIDKPDHDRFFAGPTRRRMTAEQIVDSALHVVGQTMQTEQLTLDVEGTLPADKFLNFGFPKRSWEFTTLANERDRPSLALPRVQAITDVLKAFGWRNSRPEPTSAREETPNLIQPGALANGTLGVWLTRLSDDSGLTEAMLVEQPVELLVDQLFLRLLTREPTPSERQRFVAILTDGYDDRILHRSMSEEFQPSKRFRYVSWSNHLNSEANVIKVEMEELARRGPPPTARLTESWRERAEDALWALINSPEMILIP